MSVRIFGHYVSLPLLLLMLAEAVIHVGAVYLAVTLRFLDIHFPHPLNVYYGNLLTKIRACFTRLLQKLPVMFPRIFVRAGGVEWGVGTLLLSSCLSAQH